MIIQLRGTSGSGKSTAMNRVMTAMGEWNAVAEPGREKPLYYRYAGPDPWPNTVVLGHYETPCGGCDTVGSARQVWELTSRIVQASECVVLQEGLLLSEDVKWTQNMPGVRCLFLATDVEECISNIKKRRAAAGNTDTLREDNTRKRVDVIERARVRLLEAGVKCSRCTADQAPGVVLKWIRGYVRGTDLDGGLQRGGQDNRRPQVVGAVRPAAVVCPRRRSDRAV